MERLGQVLRRWLADTPEAAGAAELFQSWRDIVGPQLSEHTRPIEVDQGKLIVAANHPGWVQLLRIEEPAILKRLGRSHDSLGIDRIVTVLTARFDSAAR